MSVVRPASHCFRVRQARWARDNIPFSRTCCCAVAAATAAARFSPRYALVRGGRRRAGALNLLDLRVDAPGEPLGIRAPRFAT